MNYPSSTIFNSTMKPDSYQASVIKLLLNKIL